MKTEHLNPEGLHRSPAFTQAVVTAGHAKTIWVGGQNAVDASGAIVGPDDLGAQATQAFQNLEVALAAAGAGLEHVVKWGVHVVHGRDPEPGFRAFQEVWGSRSAPPPAITVLFVSALANPGFLIEIDAVAVVPDEA